MERELPDDREILSDLYEELFDLWELEERGWNVKAMESKIREEIEKINKKKLSSLRRELKGGDLNEKDKRL